MQYRAHAAAQGSTPPASPLDLHNSLSNSSRPKTSADQEGGWKPFLILTAITFCTCALVYVVVSPLFVTRSGSSSLTTETRVSQCCRGTPHQELWGRVVKAGDTHIFNSSVFCCQACKAMCPDEEDGGPCLCNSWVYCADPDSCKEKLGQCWLKMQEDPLNPDIQDSKPETMWTSGLIYGKDVGVIALETEHGSIHIKLLPECAPISVRYLHDLLKSKHCAGCQFYRAESRGNIWDEFGNRINQSSLGPPYGLLQGTLEAQGLAFKEIPREACLSIRRGTVAWIGGGPDFFISLSHHDEWYPKYTVFGSVLPADMPLVEKLVNLPTTVSTWDGITVSVLNKAVNLKVRKPSINALM